MLTLAALVRALAHRDTAVSGFSTLKNDTELCFKAAKSKAFHLYVIQNVNNRLILTDQKAKTNNKQQKIKQSETNHSSSTTTAQSARFLRVR